MNKPDTNAPVEQIAYANILFYGCWTGLGLMLVTYCLYVFGIMDPYVPTEIVTQSWSHPVDEYLSKNNVPVGWGWATLLAKGDFLNFVGIALLASLTVVGYIPLIFAYLKKKDIAFAIISLLEVIVLCVAASGIFGSGGH